jgi:hypothetical protein
MGYANAAERLLAAIGEPEMIDRPRTRALAVIFSNRTIRTAGPAARRMVHARETGRVSGCSRGGETEAVSAPQIGTKEGAPEIAREGYFRQMVLMRRSHAQKYPDRARNRAT